MKNLLDQIRERILLSSLVGRYILLKPKGNGEYLGLCPFHSEKTPSFTVSDSKKFYHCFGCNTHGDAISFVQNILQVGYREALEKLAMEAGVDLPQKFIYVHKDDKKTKLYSAILKHMASIYHRDLYSKVGTEALHYLKKRGLNDAVIARYHIGYAMQNHLSMRRELEKYFTKEDILDSGALRQMNDSGRIYNQFAGRIIFPIFDKDGTILGFGGRLIDDSGKVSNSQAKYINSADSLIFNKGTNLYGLNVACAWLRNKGDYAVIDNFDKKQEYSTNSHNSSNNKSTISSNAGIAVESKSTYTPPPLHNHVLQHPVVLNDLIKNKTIIVVEGYLDVIMLAMHGLGNTVAPLGTALKLEQIQLLWQYSKNPIICFDNDTAGHNAMERIALNALQYIESGKTLRFVHVAKVKDPADFVRQYGILHFLDLLQHNVIGLADFIFRCTLRDVGPLETPEMKAELYRKLTLLANGVNNKQLRSEYHKHFHRLYHEVTNSYTKHNVTKGYRNNNIKHDELINVRRGRLYDNDTKWYNNNAIIAERKSIQDSTITHSVRSNKYNQNITLCIESLNAPFEIRIDIAIVICMIYKFPSVICYQSIYCGVMEITFEDRVLQQWQKFVALFFANVDKMQSDKVDVNNIRHIISYMKDTLVSRESLEAHDIDVKSAEELWHGLEDNELLHGIISDICTRCDFDELRNFVLYALNLYADSIMRQKISAVETALRSHYTIGENIDTAVKDTMICDGSMQNTTTLYNTLLQLKKQHARIVQNIQKYHGFT